MTTVPIILSVIIGIGWLAPSAGASPRPLYPAKIVPCFGANCPAKHTITFDDGSVALGRQITNQYEGDGVYFADPLVNGFQSGEPQAGQDLVSNAACGSGPTLFAPQGGLTSSPPDAAQFASCGSLEFPNHGTFGFFTSGAGYVSANVGQVSAGGSHFELDAYGQDHHLIGSTTITATKTGILNPISFSAPAGQLIWSFAIYDPIENDQSDFGMDDLFYSVPPGQQPEISLTTAHTTTGGVVPSSGSLDFTLNRFNGSTGEVDLSVSGLPAGVSATFSPSALTGGQAHSTLNWSISASAYGGADAFHPAGSMLTVNATPAVPAAGAAPSPPISIDFWVSLAFGWRSLQPITLADCQTAQYDNGGAGIFDPPSSISGNGTLAVTGAGPGSGLDGAALNPGTFSNGSADPLLTLTTGPTTPPTDTTLTLSAAAPGYATQTTTLLVHRIIGEVTSWTGASGNDNIVEAPVWGTTSQTLTIYGAGFCPGTKVAFGEYGNPPSISPKSPALVTPSYISPDGTEMKVTVPHYAADGPIDVFAPGGNFASSTPLTIASGYASVNGYNFQNRNGPSVGLSDLANVFPEDEVYIQVDPCSIATFGLAHCPVFNTGIGTPQADYFLSNGGSSIAQKGECYGFSASSLFLSGLPGVPNQQPVRNFDSGAGNVNQVADNGAIDNYILDMQISQDSSQSLSQRASAQSTAAGDSAAQFESQLRADFVTPDGTLQPVVVDSFGTVKGQFSGHSVVAYDVQDTGGGGFDIYVYNSNTPYKSSNFGDSTAGTGNWVSNQQNSVIHVQANGSWSFPQTGYTGNLSTGNLFLLPADSLPNNYDLPGSFSFGNILASAPSSAQLDQVTDASGHTLLGPGRALNRTASGIAGAKLVYNIVGPDGPAAPQALLPARGSYTLTLSPNSAGVVAGGLIGRSVSASVQGTSSGKVSFSLNVQTGVLRLQPSVGSGRLTADLAAFGAKSADRTATLALAAGSTGSLTAQLTPGGSLRLADAHGSARVTVSLGSSGPSQLPGNFTSPGLVVGTTGPVVLAPASWANLGSTAVTVRAFGQRGNVSSTVLHSRLQPLRESSLHLAVDPSAHTTLLSVRASWPVAVASSAGRPTTASVVWAVLRGNRVLAQHTQTLSPRHAGLTLTRAVNGLGHGNYRAIASVVVTTGAGGPATPLASERTATATFVVH